MEEQTGGDVSGFTPAGHDVWIEDAQVELQDDAFIVDEPHQAAAQVEPIARIMDIERFATDRIPAGSRNREHFTPGSPARAQKKSRPTSEAQRDVDDRQAAVAHDRSDSDMGSPSIDAPKKKSRVEVDAEMGDLRALSAILRGVDVTEVYSPKRVVEVR